MRPTLLRLDSGNLRSAHAISTTERAKGIAGPSDGKNLSRGQLSPPRVFPSGLCAVELLIKNIVPARAPTKVFHSVVGLISVVVSNLMLWGWLRTNESKRHQSVSTKPAHLPVTEKPNTIVSVPLQILLPQHWARPLPAGNTANSAQRANLILWRYGDISPLFRNIMHRGIL